MKICVEGLSKTYGHGEARTLVLRDLELTIEPGEFVAIVGTSGSGKSTLLNVLGGLDRGFDGQVKMHAGGVCYDLSTMSERALAGVRSRHFGFVFQQFNLLDHLTGLENVALPDYFASGVLHGAASAEARARELLERVGLSDKADVRPPRLSGGQKQRLAIARALFNRPSVLLCDEPTGSLDRRTGLQIMDLFTELNTRDGITLVVVTHEEHIARMARRIVRLEDGVIVSDTPREPERPDDADALVGTAGAVRPGAREAV